MVDGVHRNVAGLVWYHTMLGVRPYHTFYIRRRSSRERNLLTYRAGLLCYHSSPDSRTDLVCIYCTLFACPRFNSPFQGSRHRQSLHILTMVGRIPRKIHAHRQTGWVDNRPTSNKTEKWRHSRSPGWWWYSWDWTGQQE